MYSIQRTAPDRLTVLLCEQIEADEMSDLIRDFEKEAADIDAGRMIIQAIDYQWPSWDALLTELSHWPKLRVLAQRFQRAAVIADKHWVRQVSAIEGALVPGLEMRTFAPDEAATAERWLEAA